MSKPSQHETPSQQPPYVPASPVKRTLAWIGVVYMVILVLLMTYYFFTATMLTNLAPLLSVPALLGLGAVSIVSWKTTGRPGKWAAWSLAAASWLLAVVTVPIGIAGLMTNFPGGG